VVEVDGDTDEFTLVGVGTVVPCVVVTPELPVGDPADAVAVDWLSDEPGTRTPEPEEEPVVEVAGPMRIVLAVGVEEAVEAPGARGCAAGSFELPLDMTHSTPAVARTAVAVSINEGSRRLGVSVRTTSANTVVESGVVCF
jgi:hypothetical protein